MMVMPIELTWFCLDDSLKDLAFNAFFNKLSVNKVQMHLTDSNNLSATSYPLSPRSQIKDPSISVEDIRAVRVEAHERHSLFVKSRLVKSVAPNEIFLYTHKEDKPGKLIWARDLIGTKFESLIEEDVKGVFSGALPEIFQKFLLLTRKNREYGLGT